MMPVPPGVLVFSGSDPSGGAGMQADIPAILAQGAHPFTVPTVLTVQDNVRVHAIHVVDADVVRHQAQVLLDRFTINAVKLGVIGSLANAQVIVDVVRALRKQNPQLPVVLDPVLANTSGDDLSRDDAVDVMALLYPLATVITPNLDEARRLCRGETDYTLQARLLLDRGCDHVLLKGGHGPEDQDVVNRWYAQDGTMTSWQWTRLPGEFHGSGCTLAAALAGCLAHQPLAQALLAAQVYTQQALQSAYRLADGQPIPNRMTSHMKEAV